MGHPVEQRLCPKLLNLFSQSLSQTFNFSLTLTVDLLRIWLLLYGLTQTKST